MDKKKKEGTATPAALNLVMVMLNDVDILLIEMFNQTLKNKATLSTPILKQAKEKIKRSKEALGEAVPKAAVPKAAAPKAAPKAAAAEEAPKKKLIDAFSKDEKVKELFRKSYPEAKKKEQRTIYGKLRNVFNMLKNDSITETEAKEEELKPNERDLFFYMVNNNMFMGAEEYVKKRNEQRKTKDKADEEFRQAQIKAGQRYE